MLVLQVKIGFKYTIMKRVSSFYSQIGLGKRAAGQPRQTFEPAYS
jgi:hypothetical protein